MGTTYGSPLAMQPSRPTRAVSRSLWISSAVSVLTISTLLEVLSECCLIDSTSEKFAFGRKSLSSKVPANRQLSWYRVAAEGRLLFNNRAERPVLVLSTSRITPAAHAGTQQ